MKRVVLESPYSGDIKRNLTYARRCVKDCLSRGESPIASHLLFTQEGILDDSNPEERGLGMEAGWAWIIICDYMVVYQDYGTSPGMAAGIKMAELDSIEVEYRKIGENA